MGLLDEFEAEVAAGFNPFIVLPEALRERREREYVVSGGFEVIGDLGQLLFRGVDDAAELGVHGVHVGLVVNTVSRVFTQGPLLLGVSDIRFAA